MAIVFAITCTPSKETNDAANELATLSVDSIRAIATEAYIEMLNRVNGKSFRRRPIAARPCRVPPQVIRVSPRGTPLNRDVCRQKTAKLRQSLPPAPRRKPQRDGRHQR
jgi:hypothetical protein